MSTLIAASVVISVVVVVLWLFGTLWRVRQSPSEGRTAIAAGVVLAAWAALLLALAANDVFRPRPGQVVPAVGLAFASALIVWWGSLVASPSLARLFARAQPSLVRMHLWRLLGPFVFFYLLAQGRLPALFALPAGLGDFAIGVTALSMARALDRLPRSPVVLWHAFGVLDLVVALTMGVTTNPGPANVFRTSPSSVVVTSFPFVLIPTFLVPMALTLHAVSLRLIAEGRPSRSLPPESSPVRA